MNASINPFSLRLDDTTISCLTSLIRVEKNENRALKVIAALNKLHGIGKKELENTINGKGNYARYYKEIKEHLHLVRSAIYTAALVAKTVNELEKHGKLKQIVDFGCGPSANIARALNRKIINLDASQEMLDLAKKACEEYRLDCEFVKSFMQNTLFENSYFDLVIASNSLNFNRNTAHEREIEDVLLETNRILRQGGYFIVTFPYGRCVSEKDFKNLTELTKNYGFNPIVSDVFKGIDKKGKAISHAYMLVASKTQAKKGYENVSYNLFSPPKYVVSGGKKLLRLQGELYNLLKQKEREGDKKTLLDIKYVTKDGKNLEDVLK